MLLPVYLQYASLDLVYFEWVMFLLVYLPYASLDLVWVRDAFTDLFTVC